MPTPNQLIGSFARIILTPETEWGVTPVGAEWKGLRFVSEELRNDISSFTSEAIDAGRARHFARLGKHSPGGPIVVEFGPEGYNTLMKHLLNAVPSTSGSGPYVHTIKAGANLPVGLSIEKGWTNRNFYFLYKGCRVNSATFEIPTDGIVRCTFNILAREELPALASQDATVPYSLTEPFVSHESNFMEGAILSTLGTVAAAKLEVSNNMEADVFTAPSRYRYDIAPMTRDVTGSLTVLFNDITLYAKFKNETPTGLRIRLTAADGKWAQLRMYKAKFMETTPTPVTADAGTIRTEFGFRALYDATEGTDLEYTVSNNEASI